jgi:predicted alpha/beta-hydrolase family hydrolase
MPRPLTIADLLELGARELSAAGRSASVASWRARRYAAPVATRKARASLEIDTGAGAARVELDQPDAATFLFLMTHGAGGGVESADLRAVRDVSVGLGGAVARVLQPYRVRGVRAPGSADRQDAAWLEIVAALQQRFPGLPLIQGGRSNGARVACRTAVAAGARGVVALAFPLHPPGQPGRSRAGELLAARTNVLVVNGDRDPFGVPDEAAGIRVVVLPGETHALSKDPATVGATVGSWLAGLLGGQ